MASRGGARTRGTQVRADDRAAVLGALDHFLGMSTADEIGEWLNWSSRKVARVLSGAKDAVVYTGGGVWYTREQFADARRLHARLAANGDRLR